MIRLRNRPVRPVDRRAGRDSDQIRVVSGPWNDPHDARFLDRADGRFNLLLAYLHAVRIKLHAVRARPRRAEHGDGHAHQFTKRSCKVADLEFVFHGHLRQQAQADQHAAFKETPTGFLDVDLSGDGIAAHHVAAALTDDVAAHIVTVARTDRRDAVAVIQQRKPVAKRQHQIRLQRGGIDDLHRVEAEFKPAPVLAGDGIEVLFGERLKIVMNVAWMI